MAGNVDTIFCITIKKLWLKTMIFSVTFKIKVDIPSTQIRHQLTVC